MGLISNWKWRMHCRKTFARAASNVYSSPYGNLGEMSGMLVTSMLGEARDELYNRYVLWHCKSKEILEQEFKRAFEKYVLNKRPFYERYPGATEWILAIIAVILLLSSALIHPLLCPIVLILLIVGLVVLCVNGFIK